MVRFYGNDESDSPELLGVFGWAWQEIIAKNIGMPISMLNASLYDPVINSMRRAYDAYKQGGISNDETMAQMIAQDTAQPIEYARKFVPEIRRYEETGKAVSRAPTAAEAVTRSFSQDIIGFDLKKALMPFVILAGIGIVAYGMSQVKSFIPQRSKG
jgi:hypothetical protein